jgi:hypothetical protein
MRAAVLLDAAYPGHTPALIPGLVRVRQAPGIYNTKQQLGILEATTAMRQGNAWIVVSGGGRNAEEARIRLLRHLRATIKL